MLKNSVIWVCSLALCLLSGLTVIGGVAKKKAPELAVTIQPLNGFAAEELLSDAIRRAIVDNQGRFPDDIDESIRERAELAFVSEPLTPQAVAGLALGEENGTKRELMRSAFALSRREQLITSWMISDSGAREDIPAILGYYDTLLRSSSSSSAVVIPILAGALANENFIEPFAGLLSKNPPWAGGFWRKVVSTPQAIANAARLRERLHKANERGASYNDAALVRALVENKQFQAAERLYSLLAKQPQDRTLMKNSSFEQDPQFPPLDWQLFSTGEYGAAISEGSLQLSAIRSSGGLLARQLVKLPASRMKIESISAGEIPRDMDIDLRISCAEAIDKLPRPIRFSLSGKVTRKEISNQTSGCSYYWFDIVGRASENGDGFDVAISAISLQVD